ncbi:MAG: hypothetical protein J6Z01_16660 [Bacteroidales bacterium]|nr:hypothetical protein [Bacteroidales bacterium]
MGKSEFVASGNHGIFDTDQYYPKSGSYDFRYKSVESGKTDRVVVDFGSYSEKDSVIFKDKYGVKLKVVDGNILTFTGVNQADTNFIYAYRGDQKIGKLFLNTYQKKTYKVVLVSVNKATLPDIGTLENYLNKVYRQCVDSFVVDTRQLSVSGIENFTHGGTKVAGSVWNASQKAVLEAFGEKYEDNTAYLFFIPKAETNGVAGYMPRYYPYGFIYPGAANRTIAHELGHGIAGLEHPFPESQVSGNTANLMDYREGEELWHFQWDMLQDPARKIFKWWQNEQGAEAFDLDLITGVELSNGHTLGEDMSDIIVLTPGGRPFTLLDNTVKVAFQSQISYVGEGVLTWFKTSDDITYTSYFSNKRFLGYVKVVGTDANDIKNYVEYSDPEKKHPVLLKDIKTQQNDIDNLKNHDIIVGLNTLGSVDLYLVKGDNILNSNSNIVNELQSEDYYGAGDCSDLKINDYTLSPWVANVGDKANNLKSKIARNFFENHNRENPVHRAVILRISKLLDNIVEMHKDEEYALEENAFSKYSALTTKYFADPKTWSHETEYKYLEESLKELYNNKKDFEKRILSCENASQLADLAYMYISNYPESMNSYVRLHIINHLSQGRMNAKQEFGYLDYINSASWLCIPLRNLLTNDYENVTIDLLDPQYITEENASNIIRLLSAPDKCIMKHLVDHVDGEQFAILTSKLLNIWIISQGDNLFNTEDAEDFFLWQKADVLECSSALKNVRTATHKYNDHNQIVFEQYYGFMIEHGTSSTHNPLSPFAKIKLKFSSNPKFFNLEDEDFKKLLKNKEISIPAFFLDWMCYAYNDGEIEKYVTGTIASAATIASFFSASAAVAAGTEAASSGFIYGLHVADLVGSTFNMYAYYAALNEVMKGTTFEKSWSYISPAFSVVKPSVVALKSKESIVALDKFTGIWNGYDLSVKLKEGLTEEDIKCVDTFLEAYNIIIKQNNEKSE